MFDDSAAVAAIAAIRAGDLASLRDLLAAAPELAGSRLNGVAKGRTPLHIAADWPGYFPNGPAVVALLIAAGADPNARSESSSSGESPLHWAASSDDADVARALIDGGADIELADGSIGTPLDNAVGYACWHVARLLVARGARVDKLWHAAALGDLDVVDRLIAAGATAEELSQAFWHACDAAQRRAAQLLLDAGADPTWIPEYGRRTALETLTAPATRESTMLDWLKAISTE